MTGRPETGPRSARNGLLVRGYQPCREGRSWAGFLACAGHCGTGGAAP